nr:hypothetical protein Iba_chr03aCG5830 [Ipomoea batatas]
MLGTETLTLPCSDIPTITASTTTPQTPRCPTFKLARCSSAVHGSPSNISHCNQTILSWNKSSTPEPPLAFGDSAASSLTAFTASSSGLQVSQASDNNSGESKIKYKQYLTDTQSTEDIGLWGPRWRRIDIHSENQPNPNGEIAAEFDSGDSTPQLEPHCHSIRSGIILRRKSITVPAPGCIELHYHKLVTVHKVVEVPICQDNNVLIINLGAVVHFLLTIESRQNLKIVVILEVFIVVLRFIVPSEVVRIRLVSVLSYASVVVRFEETRVFIVIVGCGFGQRLIGEANRDRRR